MNVCRKNDQYMNEHLEGSDILGYRSSSSCCSQGRLPGGGRVDSGTEHIIVGNWARLLPMAQQIDITNSQDIFIWLNAMSPRQLLNISERSWPPAAASAWIASW